MRGRPLLHTSYASDMALLNTRAKRVCVGVLLVLALALPLLVADELLQLLAVCCVAAIGAIGLGLVTGYAGQISLGHAFFLAIGAYTAAAISNDPGGRTIGLGISNISVWLPAAGVVAGVAGVLVAPLATRLRGLYLAVVTLGLVFIGQHVFNEWRALTGGAGVGRPPATLDFFGHRIDVTGAYAPGPEAVLADVRSAAGVRAGGAQPGPVEGGAGVHRHPRPRHRGRRHRGEPARYKTIAFAMSSFYAGCAGALLFTVSGFMDPSSFSLRCRCSISRWC